MRDPRSHRRYVEAAREFKRANLGAPCALCGRPVLAQPTVEHRLKVSTILAMTATYDEAVALACDVSLWGLAHSRCNSQQGARLTNARRRSNSSRW